MAARSPSLPNKRRQATSSEVSARAAVGFPRRTTPVAKRRSERIEKMKVSELIRRSASYLIVVFSFCVAASASAQTGEPSPSAKQSPGEQHTERSLQTARANPIALRHFLFTMPKGADLHMHLSGAVYAESFIRAAAEDHLCVDVASLSFAKPQAPSNANSPQSACDNGKVPAIQGYKDSH